MLAIPAGGVDDLRRMESDLAAYCEFLRETTGLLVIQRLDLVSDLAAHSPTGILVDGPVSGEMRAYLEPLARRTTLEAFTEFALPAGAFLLSVTAIVVAMAK